VSVVQGTGKGEVMNWLGNVPQAPTWALALAGVVGYWLVGILAAKAVILYDPFASDDAAGVVLFWPLVLPFLLLAFIGSATTRLVKTPWFGERKP